MDGKMKGMIMAGMMALSLVLGILGVLGNAWLDADSDAEDDMEGYSMSSGLNNVVITIDLTKFADGNAKGECDAMLKEMQDDDGDIDAECDDADTVVTTMSISEMCDEAESDLADAKDAGLEGDALDDAQESVDDVCATASAGTMGTIGMWAGIVCALVATLMLVLPMAGVDAMDAIPDMGKMIVTWGAGGLMLLGMLLWYLMLPDGDSSMGLHLWLAGAAMTIGLGAAATGQFIPADE
jgi:hypothetical protein